MIQSQNITVPRGKNVGNAIKDFLIEHKLYKKVSITNIQSKRDIKAKAINVEFTYEFN